VVAITHNLWEISEIKPFEIAIAIGYIAGFELTYHFN